VNAVDQTGSLLRWLAAHDLPSVAVFVCAGTAPPRAPRGSLAVVTPGCVTGLGSAVVAQVLALGVARVAPACGCDPAGGPATAAAWARVFPGGLADLSAPGRFWRRPAAIELAHVPVPRRVLLGRRDEAPLDPRRPEPSRIRAAFDRLSAEGRADLAALAATGEAAPGLTLSVTACTACGVCVQGCPAGALALVHSEAGSTLSHDRSLCSGHAACADLCPERAIAAGPLTLAGLAARPVVALATVASVLCPRCHARHPAAEGDLCRLCAFRSRHSFGLPPDLPAHLRQALHGR
jgi:NAD-dependent dihydropyrimidine dehydrogenase PreA subunit